MPVRSRVLCVIVNVVCACERSSVVCACERCHVVSVSCIRIIFMVLGTTVRKYIAFIMLYDRSEEKDKL